MESKLIDAGKFAIVSGIIFLTIAIAMKATKA